MIRFTLWIGTSWLPYLYYVLCQMMQQHVTQLVFVALTVKQEPPSVTNFNLMKFIYCNIATYCNEKTLGISATVVY